MRDSREDLISIKVDNLSSRVDKYELREAFTKFGEVGDVYIPNDPRSGMPRAYAFVRFVSQEDADAAAREMDGRDIGGREVKVQMASIGKGKGGGRGRGGFDRGHDRDRGYDRGYDRDRYSRRERSYSRGRRDRSYSRGRRSYSRGGDRSYSRDRYRSRSRGY